MKIKIFILRKTALVLAVVLLFQSFYATPLMGLTSGPSQPEFQSFQPAGVSDMVDLFSGNFSYNIPLLDVGGYPLNISYAADPRMDDEASWVGLGWTLNPGSISRQMRGLPDDYKGDTIKKSFNIADDLTLSVAAGPNFELFGIKKPSKSLASLAKVGLTFNSRRGFELELNSRFRADFSIAKSMAPLSAGLSAGYSPSRGIDLQTSLGMANQISNQLNLSNDMALGYNSRQGLRSLTFQNSLSHSNNHLGILGSTSFNFMPGSFAYTPTAALPLKNTAGTFHFTVGAAFYGANPNAEVNASYSIQTLAKNHEDQKGYGYLYLQDGAENESNVLDYNSELHGQLKEETPHLPIAYGTSDLFMIHGQGIAGSFKAKRTDHGIFRPAKESNNSVAGSLGGEIGTGGFFKGGLDLKASISTTTKKEWEDDDNYLGKALSFKSNSGTQESVYFQPTSDNVVNQSRKYDRTLGTLPIRAKPIKSGLKIKAANHYQYTQPTGESEAGAGYSDYSDNQRNIRNQSISFLTHAEVVNRFSQKNNRYADYPFNELVIADCNDTEIEYLQSFDHQQAHHISEFYVGQPDGSRYVYGQPVYNVKQKEVSFSVDQSNRIYDAEGDASTSNVNSPFYGLVNYQSGVDNSINNRKGSEHYFDANELTPYAHSFLLTELLSPDYVDKTGDGVTDDDVGNAIKFNYSRMDSDYQWRIPFQANKAKYHPGLKSTDEDDKASYHYGSREIWYTHSIESRTMIALFHTSERADGLGVLGENGGPDQNTRLRKLDKIELFSKSELQNNPANPVPIKTVHFEYDYSLCPGVPNHLFPGQGKLTLKKIYFTYGKNQRGLLNAYLFDYKNGAGYHLNQYDRWGFYKKNPTHYRPNHEFPYVLQHDEAELTQEWAGMWNLESIMLPSGGVIHVDYEADDYAFVQDKRAADMMEVLGMTYDATSPITPEIYGEQDLVNGRSLNKYVAVRIPVFESSVDMDLILKRYMDGIDQVYFNALIELYEGEESTAERISGYFTIDKNEDVVLRDEEILLIPVKYLKDNQGRDIHPLTFAALQVMRHQIPELVYPGYKNLNGPLVAIGKGLVGLFDQILNTAKGFEYNAMSKEWGKVLITQNHASWVRLTNPNWSKLGGGSRVNKITISDEWNQGNEGPSIYGQSYDYTKTMMIMGNEMTISSGVASYEPAIGGEENMMKKPLAYEEKKQLVPKNLFYSESPIGESLFPSPSVGYSRVTVSDIANANPDIFRTQSGRTIHEFYTARDFPTIVETTDVKAEETRLNSSFSFLRSHHSQSRGVAQGISIELNDMHGKTKRQTVYDKNDVPLTSTEYRYKVENPSDPQGRLSNDVNVIETNGQVSSAELGIDVCIWQEMLEETNVSKSAGLQVGIDIFPLALIPGVISTSFPELNYQKTQFRAAITTKLIQRKGILDKVIVTENGSTIETKNIAFDRETGSVLLTRTQNEFNDDLFAFNYPAHWVYDNMGQAYQNIGSIFKQVLLDEAKFLPNNFQGLLNPGDEVLVTIEGDVEEETFYISTNTYLNNRLVLLNNDGTEYYQSEIPVDIKVIRSAKKNMASAAIGQITSRVSPITAGRLNYNQNTKVINASAQTYSDNWSLDCKVSEEEALVPTAYAYGLGTLPASGSFIIEDWSLNGITHANIAFQDLASLESVLNNITGADIWTFMASDLTLVANNVSNEYGRLKIRHESGQQLDAGINEVLTRQKTIANQECAFNPYTSGYYNAFRPESSYVYYQDRTASSLPTRNQGMRIRDKGYVQNFTPYWEVVGGVWEQNAPNNENWTFTNQITEYDSKGNEVENVNAIGVHSAAIFGFKDALATAVANNAKHREIYYQSFEDLVYDNDCQTTALKAGLNLYDPDFNSPVLSSDIAHTGKHSLRYDEPKSYSISLAPACSNCYDTQETETLTFSNVPSDITVNCEEVPFAETPTLNQANNCNTLGIITFEESTTSGSCPDNYTLRRTWSAEDDCGNVGQVTQTITVSDNVAPIILGVPPNTDANCTSIPTASGVIASDLCDQSVSLLLEEILQPSDAINCQVPYTITRIWTAIDACGNQSQAQQIINVFRGERLTNDQSRKPRSNTKSFDNAPVVNKAQTILSVSKSTNFLDADRPTEFYRYTSEEADIPFVNNCEACLPSFMPFAGKAYAISAWIANDLSIQTGRIPKGSIQLFDQDNVLIKTLKASGPVVEGWQRIEAKVILPQNAQSIILIVDNEETEMYLDDFRIHPFRSNMNSYVYDPFSLRLMATLDENNYASFYEYDDEGILIRVKRETEKGIATVQEGRTVLKPNNTSR